MNFKAKLQNLSRDLNGDMLITFVAYKDIVDAANDLKDKLLNVEAKPYKEKRSLNANAYFHKLLSMIAAAAGTSTTYQKNYMIAQYGQEEYIDGRLAEVYTQIPPEQMAEQEYLHLRPAGMAWVNGDLLNRYTTMRGSHTYNKSEMARLIDGTVEEARALGIDTMTPDERARMIAAWEAYK